MGKRQQSSIGSSNAMDEVPVWIMSSGDFLDALADGGLTVSELEALPSLFKGSASFYHETFHPLFGHKLIANK
jgi:hypothetical protein